VHAESVHYTGTYGVSSRGLRDGEDGPLLIQLCFDIRFHTRFLTKWEHHAVAEDQEEEEEEEEECVVGGGGGGV